LRSLWSGLPLRTGRTKTVQGIDNTIPIQVFFLILYVVTIKVPAVQTGGSGWTLQTLRSRLVPLDKLLVGATGISRVDHMDRATGVVHTGIVPYVIPLGPSPRRGPGEHEHQHYANTNKTFAFHRFAPFYSSVD
jgi:hypothetical protein